MCQIVTSQSHDVGILRKMSKIISASYCIYFASSHFVQMITVYSPLTWGIYDEPPPDVPDCGFVGEFCLPPIRGKSDLLDDRIDVLVTTYNFASYSLPYSFQVICRKYKLYNSDCQYRPVC